MVADGGRFREALEDMPPELEHVVNAVNQPAVDWLLFYMPVLPGGK